MTMENIYAKVLNLQRIAWRGDDLMDQTDLFELQEELANLTMEMANQLGKCRELVKEFPLLYRVAVKRGQS